MRISDWSSDVCSSDLYDADPKKVPTAKRYDSLTFDRVLADNLKVMDASAVALCRDSDIPIVVFNIRGEHNRSEERRVGKGVSVRVDLGGRRIIQKKKYK